MPMEQTLAHQIWAKPSPLEFGLNPGMTPDPTRPGSYSYHIHHPYPTDCNQTHPTAMLIFRVQVDIAN